MGAITFLKTWLKAVFNRFRPRSRTITSRDFKLSLSHQFEVSNSPLLALSSRWLVSIRAAYKTTKLHLLFSKTQIFTFDL